jgi:hypothetical protein
MAGVHQEADFLEFLLDHGEILAELGLLLACERVSIN